MDKFYHFLTLTGIGLYWFLVAGVTLRVVLKRRAVSVSFSLANDHLYPSRAWRRVLFPIW